MNVRCALLSVLDFDAPKMDPFDVADGLAIADALVGIDARARVLALS